MIVALGSTPACCLYSDYSNIKIFYLFIYESSNIKILPPDFWRSEIKMRNIML